MLSRPEQRESILGARRQALGYTGGEATPQAIESISNLRTIKQPVYNAPFDLGQTARIRLPEVGYSKIYRIVIKGNLNVDTTGGVPTAGNPAQIIQNINYSLQSATRFHSVTGVQEQQLNLLDNAQVVPPKSVFSVGNGDNAFYQEFRLQLSYSEANLFGLVYKGGGSTYPLIELTAGRIESVLDLNGGSAEFTTLNCTVYEERIDAEAPLAPRVVVVGEGENAQEITRPGEGLWRETSSFIESLVTDVKDVNGPRQDVRHDFELGLPYLRVIMLAFRNNRLDVNDTLINSYRLLLENTTVVIDHNLDDSDMNYRETFHHERPGGVHVITFRDKTASDRDIMYTAELGRMQLLMETGEDAPAGAAENNYIQLVTQRMVPLQSPAAY